MSNELLSNYIFTTRSYFETNAKLQLCRFDINKRTAYTMRVLGHGHSGIEKFTSLLNMPKPMTQNNYDKIILKIYNVTKTVAEETMSDAATDIREKYIVIML